MRSIPLLLALSATFAQALPYPPGAGFVDATLPPYGAKGDGVTDDTAAIQRAISANAGRFGRGSRTILLPPGTYLVSGTLDWRDINGRNGAHVTLQGAGRDRTIIRLADNSPGFDDPTKPKAVIYTRANHNPEWYKHSPQGEALGEGHVAFHNNLFDFTLDTGSGNPGAIGIDYHSNNQGSIARVDVRSGDGSGVCAFELTRRNVGPSFIENIRSTGFNHGLRFAGLYCAAIQSAEFQGALVSAVVNSGGVVAARNLKIGGAPVAVANPDPDGLVNLLDSHLSGNGDTALVGPGKWLIRDSEIEGFTRSAVRASSPGIGKIPLWTSDPSIGSPAESRIQVPSVPDVEEIPADGWADATTFGAKPDDFEDDTAAIQAALDSGKPGILFPFSDVPDSRYLVTRPLLVPPGVRRIAGAFSNFFAIPGPGFPKDAVTPVFRTSGDGGPLLVDRVVVRIKKDIAGQAVSFEHGSSRPLIMRHALLNGFRSAEGSGPLFLMDVSAHASEPQTFDFAAGTKVFAWQLDSEDWSRTKITNRGAALWILGLKTERPSTVLEQHAGRSEIYGGLFYQHHPMDPSTPALLLKGGSLEASFATTTGGPATQPGYAILLKDATSASPVEIGVAEVARRGGNPNLAIVPLLCAPLPVQPPEPTPEDASAP